MKKVLVSMMLVMSAGAFAQATPGAAPGGGSFQEHKAKAEARIQEHQKRIAEADACVKAATTNDALKACHQKAKEGHPRMHHMGPQGQAPQK